MKSVNTLVEFKDVGKTYDGKTLALNSLNLDIRHGEFLTLLGPSGSGKSTTLMLLAGFEMPTKGEILFEGKDLSKQPAYHRNFGMVFQDYALFPHMNVLRNIAYPLLMRRIGKADAMARAYKALDMVRLTQFSDRMPSQLSGGQQQRVALARALVFEPKIVLMDEPLGALDKNLREEMQIELKHLHEDLGVTFVFVTHDQDEALTMSDRIAVFNNGQIEQIASPGDLYETPENIFVAQFIGETNLLPGKVSNVGQDSISVELLDGSIVQATNVSGLSEGEKALVSIRPERMELAKNDIVVNSRSFKATMLEAIYHGSYASVRFLLGNDQIIIAKMDVHNMPETVRKGNEVHLMFCAEHARAFRPEIAAH